MVFLPFLTLPYADACFPWDPEIKCRSETASYLGHLCGILPSEDEVEYDKIMYTRFLYAEQSAHQSRFFC